MCQNIPLPWFIERKSPKWDPENFTTSQEMHNIFWFMDCILWKRESWNLRLFSSIRTGKEVKSWPSTERSIETEGEVITLKASVIFSERSGCSWFIKTTLSAETVPFSILHLSCALLNTCLTLPYLIPLILRLQPFIACHDISPCIFKLSLLLSLAVESLVSQSVMQLPSKRWMLEQAFRPRDRLWTGSCVIFWMDDSQWVPPD